MEPTAPAPPGPRFPLAVRTLLTVAVLLVAMLSGGLVAALLPPVAGRFVGTAVLAGTALGLAVILVRRVDRRPVSALGLAVDRAALRGSLLGLAAVAVACAVTTLLAAAAGLTQAPPPGQRLSVLVVLALLTHAFVLQGIPEEVLFRGYLVQTAQGRLPRWGVVAVSVLPFTVLHLLSASAARTAAERLLYLLLPLGFALIATLLRLATNSVWPAVAVHGGFHVSFVVAGLWVTPAPDTYGTYLALAGGVLLATGAAVSLVARWAGGERERTAERAQPAPPEAGRAAREEREGQAIVAGNRSQTR